MTTQASTASAFSTPVPNSAGVNAPVLPMPLKACDYDQPVELVEPVEQLGRVKILQTLDSDLSSMFFSNAVEKFGCVTLEISVCSQRISSFS